MITVKDWMSKPVMTIKPNASVHEAATTMSKHSVGSLVVSRDNKRPDGILTERDVLRKIIANRKDPDATKVEDIMTKKAVTVDVDTSLLEISKIMSKNLLRRIVVTEKDKMIGIITSRDLLQLMAG